MSETRCPDCGEKYPRFRIPTSFRQALRGGQTCKNCGCEIDKSGNKITDIKDPKSLNKSSSISYGSLSKYTDLIPEFLFFFAITIFPIYHTIGLFKIMKLQSIKKSLNSLTSELSVEENMEKWADGLTGLADSPLPLAIFVLLTILFAIFYFREDKISETLLKGLLGFSGGFLVWYFTFHVVFQVFIADQYFYLKANFFGDPDYILQGSGMNFSPYTLMVKLCFIVGIIGSITSVFSENSGD